MYTLSRLQEPFSSNYLSSPKIWIFLLFSQDWASHCQWRRRWVSGTRYPGAWRHTACISANISITPLKLAGAMIPCGLCCFCCSPNIWTWPLLGSGTLSESGTWRGEAAASRGRKIELPNSIENTWKYLKLNKINFPNIFKNSKYPVLLGLRRSHIEDAKSVKRWRLKVLFNPISILSWHVERLMLHNQSQLGESKLLREGIGGM